MARSTIAAWVCALALAGMLACGLNPQPEPPQDLRGATGGGPGTGSGNGGSGINADRDGAPGLGGIAGQTSDAAPPGADASADVGPVQPPPDSGLEAGEGDAADGARDGEPGAETGSDQDGGSD
jgi:hypothetical protein